MTPKKAILFSLFVFIPIAFGAQWLRLNPLVTFLAAGLAIVPLAASIAESTEAIAEIVGPSLGGLLNATFGNATELIIAIMALRSGLVDVVKASITGTLVANLLLALGAAIFIGGLRFKEQDFPPTVARINASSLNLALVVLLSPTAMDLAVAVAMGSSLQIAMFVAPILVLVGQAMGQPMNLDFNPFEVLAVAIAVTIANSISTDGKSNWLEGALLLITYAVVGTAFYFHP